jgi:hypothetical protein
MTTSYITKRKKFASKVINEHFEMTLVGDRSANYLWYTYKDGTKKGDFRPFILGFELNLLFSLNVISTEERNNIVSMIESEDEDNNFMAILAMESFRKKRIKIHGEWTAKQDVSVEFKELVNLYNEKIITKKSLNLNNI